MPERFSKAFKTSLIVHGLVVFVLLISPLVSRLMKPKKKERVIVVEIFSPQPPAPVPPVPEPPKPPEPEPPKPQEPPKPPEPIIQESVVQPRDIKVNTNRIVRAPTPPPAPPPPPQKTLSAKELEAMLKSSLPTSSSASPSTVSPSELDAYYGAIQRTLYAAWNQPPGVAGLKVRVSIRIARNGSIMQRNMLSGSSNQAMDASVMSALSATPTLPRFPDSIREPYLDVTITFESSGLSM